MWKFNLGKYGLYFVFYNWILYSFFGWIYESCYVSVKTKKIVNRGFLNGPIIPIYGFGGTIIGLTLSSYKGQYLLVFLMGMMLASILEYLTSFSMELIFRAKWWDYSDRKFNIHGRVCLEASLFWGLLSIVVTSVIQPFVTYLIQFIPRKSGEITGYVFIFIIFVDFIITVSSTIALRQRVSAIHKFRIEFKEYLLNTKIYEAKEELFDRYEESPISDIMDKIKRRLEVNYEKVTGRHNDIETFDLKRKQEHIHDGLRGYAKRLQKITGYRNYIHVRILKAFPNFKVPNKEGALKELKEKLLRKRNKD